MAVVVLENWKAEPEKLVMPFSRRCTRRNRAQHLIYAADEQVVFIFKVHIKSRLACGSPGRLAYRDSSVVRTFIKMKDRFRSSAIDRGEQ
jgi:hypothetical protein